VPRYTKQAVIDVIVSEAAKIFTGDKRDGEAPPITLQNFSTEMFRYGARALRARLSRMPYEVLLAELKLPPHTLPHLMPI
jgi:hypothetical protein